MPISALDAAYRAMRKAYLNKQEASRRFAKAKKRFAELNAKVFGSLPADPGSASEYAFMANEAEGVVKNLDAEYVQAQKEYDAALAAFVRVALAAGLDR